MKTDLVSIDDLSEHQLRTYLKNGLEMENMEPDKRRNLLNGRIAGVLFYEPSTRTRLSFESAMLRMGGNVIGFSEALNTSVSKGESLADTIRTVEQYCDTIIIRHPLEGSARLAAEVSRLPVINAGDGANQHPTQTLLDLYTLQKLFGQIDGLSISMVGDLKYSRTVHSLFHALAKFRDIRFQFISPDILRMPEWIINAAEGSNLDIVESSCLEEAITSSHVIYMTRIQRERFPDPVEYEKVRDSYRLDRDSLKNAPDYLKIMHPLPRVNEISTDVDSTNHAAYFPQAAYGIVMRQTILSQLLAH